MSKERELLKRVRDTLHEIKETHYDLYWDIQTALDQPEQKPLSEQFISVANQSSLEVTRFAFRQGVRFAEKAHGIGGGEWQPECCICKTNENVEWVGGYQAYRCNSKDCTPL